MPDDGGLDALLVYIKASARPGDFARNKQLGLYYVAQYAVGRGYRVKVENLSSNDAVASRLSRFVSERGIRVLGFYVDHENLWHVRRAARSLAASRGGLVIVLGGPQVGADPRGVMEQIPEAAYGVIGEGEESFAEILASALRDEPAECPGIATRNDGGVVLAAARPPFERLDELPIPRRRELEIEPDSLPFTGIMTGRGCRGVCAFCCEGRAGPEAGKKVRLRSIDNCLREIEYLVETYGLTYLTIMDDSFVDDRSRIESFCSAMTDRYEGKLKWFCEARADSLLRNAEVMRTMIEAGLIRLQIGGESGSERVLKAYRKGVTKAQVREVVKLAYEEGLPSIYVNFILGGAFEDEETISQTREFIEELLRSAPGCVDAGFSYFTPYPGTPICERPSEYGLEIDDPAGVLGVVDFHVSCHTRSLSRARILSAGQELRRFIEGLYDELGHALDFGVKERIFAAMRDWGLATDWYRHLSSDAPLAMYFEALQRGGAMRLSDALPEVERRRAICMSELRAGDSGEYYTATASGEVLRLDGPDRFLLEASSGKLTVAETIELLSASSRDDSGCSAKDAVMARLARLDRAHALLFLD